MTKKKRGKNARADLARSLLAGMAKQFPDGTEVLHFGGKKRTVDEVTALLRGFVALRDAVLAAQAAEKTRVQAAQAQEPALLEFVAEVEQFVRTLCGKRADLLAGFGLEPPREPTPMTAEAKAIANARRQATREARGIVSKKARRAVRGGVTAKLVVTPVPDA